MAFEVDDKRFYVILINHEEQYSLWPVWKAIPAGWRRAGFEGSYADCAAYVEANWTDMRPLSLRELMNT